MAAILCLGTGTVLASGAARAAAAGGGLPGGATVWLQTLDSCRQALGGASYQVLDSSGAVVESVTTPAAAPQTIGAGACPLQRGSCARTSTGCVQLSGLASSATYKVRETGTPPANRTNPEGYAPCNAGSACQAEWATVSIDGLGRVSALTTNVAPDGSTQTYPGSGAAAGSQADPVLFHDFGLGEGSCDGDHDADDHLTGTPSSHCQYPEGREATACQPYPWSCGYTGAGTSSTQSTPTKSSTNRHNGSSSRPSSPSSSSSRRRSHH